MVWSTPVGSANQLGPLTPNHSRIELTVPEAVKRKMKIVVMAIDEVTDGK